MTTGLAALPADVRALLERASDDGLAAMFTAGQQPGATPGQVQAAELARAQMEHRDREALRERARARRREAAAATRAAAEAEWLDAAHAHFLRAEAALAGNLTAPGSRIGEPFPGLYRISSLDFCGTQDDHGLAGRQGQASEEMREFCRADPRPVRSDYIRRAFGPRKGTGHDYPWRDDPTWAEPGRAQIPARETEPAREAHSDLGAGESAPPPVTGTGSAAQRREARAQANAERLARVQTCAPGAVAAARAGRQAGPVKATCEHPGRTPGLCGDCPRDAGTTVAVPAAGKLVTPGASSVMSPARAVPGAAELLPQLLGEIGLLLTDYVWFPSQSAAVAVTVWAAHAAVRDAERNLITRASPRLILTSEENGSGKSTVLDMLRILLQVRSGRMAKVTAPGLAMLLSKFRDTALLDEVNVTFGSGRDARDVQAILLAGYSRGGTWVNGRGGGTVMDVTGAAAMAGKDDLITKQREPLKDLLARSIIVRMTRPPMFLPQLDEDAEDRAARLSRALWAIMGSLGPQLTAASRDLARDLAGSAITDGDGGRVAQIWRPLDAVARIAGGRWPDAVAQARAELSAASGDLLTAQTELDGLEEARAALGSAGRNFWDE